MGKNDEVEATEAEKAGQEIAVKQWAHAKEKFLPSEKVLANIATDKTLRRENELSQVGSDAAVAFKDGRSGIVKNATSRGINPNSGAVSDRIAETGDTQGEAMGAGGTNVLQQRETQRRELGKNVIATGREIEAQTMKSYGMQGDITGQGDLARSMADADAAAGWGEAAGTAVGFGIGSIPAKS
jgi:hypothetical protein